MLKFVKNIFQIFCSGQPKSADSRSSANRSILHKPAIGLTQAKELDPSILRWKVASSTDPITIRARHNPAHRNVWSAGGALSGDIGSHSVFA